MKPGLSLPICIVIHHDKLNTSGTEMVEVKIMKCFRPLHDLFISWTLPVFNIKYQHFNSFVVVSNLLLPWTNNSFRNITANNIWQYFLKILWNIFCKCSEIFSVSQHCIYCNGLGRRWRRLVWPRPEDDQDLPGAAANSCLSTVELLPVSYTVEGSTRAPRLFQILLKWVALPSWKPPILMP